MSEITPIEAYATTDGRIFPTQREAQAHQYGLDIKKEVWAFFEYDGRPSYFDIYTATKIGAVIDWEVAKKMKQTEDNK
jgi:hypothetical protein